MKSLKKKSFHNKNILIYIYNIGATDIVKFDEVLLKTIPTIGNEKEQ